MSFTAMMDDLHRALEAERDRLARIRNVLKLYNELSRISDGVGSRHGVTLVVSLFDTKKVLAFDTYGRENVTVVVDKFRTRLGLPREVIKSKAREVFRDDAIEVRDAVAYENNEGVKILFRDGGRIDVLPGSFHIWRGVDDRVREFCDWLMRECYRIGSEQNGGQKM
ncbi:MAG: hypothetical protein RMJ59_03995 [Candidatus Nitrosocaldus sp.]|nr:hypothetical protein [Candidatus Nitrosocaldus sp.]MCS7141105.1 hypothetical protein [Candidatus Nitrosocaldus sp.]MDW8000069.1 hypothetical protein [Candidatus Nitrosocaldus sp.]MDW8275527.1 hypothetical protein [Candidatus Nitrosocaldus sp.]